jgi:hypothetical protein
MSPSPMRPTSSLSTRSDGLIPKYMWPRGGTVSFDQLDEHSTDCYCLGSQHAERRSPSVTADSFDLREHSYEDRHRASSDSLDPGNLSIGHSGVCLSGLDRSDRYHSSDEVCSL